MTPLNQKFLQLVFSPLEYTNFIDQRNSVERAYKADEAYWEQLPTCLIARCPLCGATYTDKLDTHSLEAGWDTHDSDKGVWFFTKKYQQVGCDHRLSVQKFVNLEGQIPTEVSGYAAQLHVPFVMPFLVPDDIPSVAVIHSFAICRLEDEHGRIYDLKTHAFRAPLTSFEAAWSKSHQFREKRRIEERSAEDTAALERAVFVPRYTAYAVTYYAYEQDQQTLENRRMNPQKHLVDNPEYEYEAVWLASMGEMHGTPAYDLRYWVERGKLQWLDLESPDLPLKAGPATDFPYVDIQFDWGKRTRFYF